MPAYNDVFPRANLDGGSAAWARDIERAVRDTSHGVERAAVAAGMDNRAQASQMGSLGRQLGTVAAVAEELVSRSTHVVPIEGMVTQLQLPADYQNVSKVVKFTVTPPPPRDRAERTAMVYLFGTGYNNDTVGFKSGGVVRARIRGIATEGIAAPTFNSVPPGYFETLSLAVPVPVGNRFDVEMLVIAANNDPGTKNITIGLTDASAVVVYGEKTYG